MAIDYSVYQADVLWDTGLGGVSATDGTKSWCVDGLRSMVESACSTILMDPVKSVRKLGWLCELGVWNDVLSCWGFGRN